MKNLIIYFYTEADDSIDWTRSYKVETNTKDYDEAHIIASSMYDEIQRNVDDELYFAIVED